MNTYFINKLDTSTGHIGTIETYRDKEKALDFLKANAIKSNKYLYTLYQMNTINKSHTYYFNLAGNLITCEEFKVFKLLLLR